MCTVQKVPHLLDSDVAIGVIVENIRSPEF